MEGPQPAQIRRHSLIFAGSFLIFSVLLLRCRTWTFLLLVSVLCLDSFLLHSKHCQHTLNYYLRRLRFWYAIWSFLNSNGSHFNNKLWWRSYLKFCRFLYQWFCWCFFWNSWQINLWLRSLCLTGSCSGCIQERPLLSGHIIQLWKIPLFLLIFEIYNFILAFGYSLWFSNLWALWFPLSLFLFYFLFYSLLNIFLHGIWKTFYFFFFFFFYIFCFFFILISIFFLLFYPSLGGMEKTGIDLFGLFLSSLSFLK